MIVISIKGLGLPSWRLGHAISSGRYGTGLYIVQRLRAPPWSRLTYRDDAALRLWEAWFHVQLWNPDAAKATLAGLKLTGKKEQGYLEFRMWVLMSIYGELGDAGSALVASDDLPDEALSDSSIWWRHIARAYYYWTMVDDSALERELASALSIDPDQVNHPHVLLLKALVELSIRKAPSRARDLVLQASAVCGTWLDPADLAPTLLMAMLDAGAPPQDCWAQFREIENRPAQTPQGIAFRHLLRARCYFAEGKLEEAQRELNSAEIGPNSRRMASHITDFAQRLRK